MTRHPTGILTTLPSLLLVILLLAGCGGAESPAQGAAASDDSASGAMPRSIAAPGATVFIMTPANGSTTTSPVAIKFGISGIAVIPAGRYDANSGHHHLLIDTELANPAHPIPSDSSHLHFGKGQTETTIELESGTHTLQLVLGDGNHVPHEAPVMSEVVTITVE